MQPAEILGRVHIQERLLRRLQRLHKLPQSSIITPTSFFPALNKCCLFASKLRKQEKSAAVYNLLYLLTERCCRAYEANSHLPQSRNNVHPGTGKYWRSAGLYLLSPYEAFIEQALHHLGELCAIKGMVLFQAKAPDVELLRVYERQLPRLRPGTQLCTAPPHSSNLSRPAGDSRAWVLMIEYMTHGGAKNKSIMLTHLAQTLRMLSLAIEGLTTPLHPFCSSLQSFQCLVTRALA